MPKYTFTFKQEDERKFTEILGRLNSDEYLIIENVTPMDPENARFCDRQTIIEMDSESALTLRMGMKELKIRRERTDEELAEEKALDERHKIKVVLKLPTESQDG